MSDFASTGISLVLLSKLDGDGSSFSGICTTPSVVDGRASRYDSKDIPLLVPSRLDEADSSFLAICTTPSDDSRTS